MTYKQTSDQATRKKRLALVINTIAPYRLPIYQALAEQYETVILHGGQEANRSWTLDIPKPLTARKVWTLQFRLKKQTGVPGVFDARHFHLNLGLVWALPLCRPDVIISNELGFRTLIAALYAKLCGIPHWVWWGGTLHSERNIGGLKTHLRRFIVRRMQHWISYGATSTEYLQSLGVERSAILQIQNCVPHETFLRAPENPRPWFPDQPRPILLAVGQLIARKGLDKLIAACGRLASQGYAFTLVLVGAGPDREQLRLQAESAQLKHVSILPNQPQSALNELYRTAQAFIFPTLEDVWGLVVNEALWTGTPVLCSRYAGCAAEIVPAANIFDPVDPENFDAALATIFDGAIQPSDPSRLMTWQQVSALILNALEGDASSIKKPRRLPSVPETPIRFEP